jgi:hypothetical protein
MAEAVTRVTQALYDTFPTCQQKIGNVNSWVTTTINDMASAYVTLESGSQNGIGQLTQSGGSYAEGLTSLGPGFAGFGSGAGLSADGLWAAFVNCSWGNPAGCMTGPVQ